MKPVLKWVGGKRQLLHEIQLYMPKDIKTYYEPFFGGGAVFFAIEPSKAIINDVNKELINVYMQIRDRPKLLIAALKEHQQCHSEEHYYLVRNIDRNDIAYNELQPLDKAARFIYLNKTCYNGLYRVNKSGHFNVPIGRYKKPKICDEETINNIHVLLKKKNIKIFNKDFEILLKNAKAGDFVYMDPPYDPVSTSASFTTYQPSGFTREEQIRLKKVCDDLNSKGVKFIVSNSNTEFISKLYKEYNVIEVLATRNINSNSSKRKAVTEVLIMNY